MTAKPEPPEAAAALEGAIDRARKVAADIQEAADSLAVVNTVLQDQLPAATQTGEVAQALEQSDEVEKSISTSARTLEAVNAEIEKATASHRA